MLYQEDVFYSCFKTRPCAVPWKSSCPRPSAASLANAGAGCPTQRALCNQTGHQDIWLHQQDAAFPRAQFYSSPTILTFPKPHIYCYSRFRTSAENKPEVSCCKKTPTGKWRCFLSRDVRVHALTPAQPSRSAAAVTSLRYNSDERSGAGEVITSRVLRETTAS